MTAAKYLWVLLPLLFGTNKGQIGCSDSATQREVVPNAIYACPGKISSGGPSGSDASGLCAKFSHVCKSATEAEELGLTLAKCKTIALTTKEFFATKESSDGYWKCNSEFNKNGENDFWGCSSSESSYHKKDCGVLNSVIGSDTKENDWTDGTSGTVTTSNEVKSFKLTNKESGGVLCCLGPTNSPTLRPTPAPTLLPTITSIDCPDGTEQIGEINADILGCGLDECDNRYDTKTIKDCRSKCLLNAYCRSFSFAPLDGDIDYPETTVCSLYNGDVSDGTHQRNQKLCSILSDDFERQLCHTTNNVNIGGESINGVISNTLISNNIIFFDVLSIDSSLLLSNVNDKISIRLHPFSNIVYSSYLEFEIYSNLIVVNRVNPSDNSKYNISTLSLSSIEYNFWIQFNPEANTAEGFIRFGTGITNGYDNELLHFPFAQFVEDEAETANLRVSYEAFKYIAISYITEDTFWTMGDIQYTLYDSCQSEDELSAFITSFGFLSTEKGTSGKVKINVYSKNNVYTCTVNEVESNEANLCTNFDYIKYERCVYDSFRQLTHLYDYVMELIYVENDYLVINQLYLDDYTILPQKTIYLTNLDGDNNVVIAFTENEDEDEDVYELVGHLIDETDTNTSSIAISDELTFGISIVTQKSSQISIEVYDESTRYICEFIPSFIGGSLNGYKCVSNADQHTDGYYNYITYSQTDCISSGTDANQMKIVIDSDGDIEIDAVTISNTSYSTFYGKTNEVLCPSDPRETDKTVLGRFIYCIDIGMISDSKPNIRPIVVFQSIFNSSMDHLNIASYTNLYRLSITTCNEVPSDSELAFLLKGVLGSSQREILSDLPSNNFMTYYIGAKSIGTFFSITFEMDGGDDAICLSEIVLVNEITDEILFKSDTSTIGKGIYLRKSCNSSYMLLRNSQFIPCYEKQFTLEAYNHRVYTRITMELCSGESDEVGLTQSAQSDFSIVITGLNAAGLYLSSDGIPIQSDRDWDSTSIMDTFREYNIICDDFPIHSISLVFINNPGIDAICIDKVIINNQQAILNSFWIGSLACADRECSPSIPAVLAWPICKTEIINQKTILTDSDIESEGDTLTMSCINYNRYSSIECSASQSYAYSYSSSFEATISNSESNGIEIASAYETTEGVEIGSEVSVGTEVSATIGMSGTDVNAGATALGTVGASMSASLSSALSASTTRSNARTSSRETTFEISSSTTFDKSEELSITCEASMEVGSFQKVNYDITKSKAVSTYTTYTDFKLTKCSYILDEDDTNPDNFIYLMNIPGGLKFQETTSCSIQFGETEFVQIEDSLTCREAQKIKGNEFDTYVPFCNPDDTTKWDGCQCETGDHLTDPTCYCVDASTGALLPTIKSSAIDTSITSWKNWCYQNCDNTQFLPDQPLVDINGNDATPRPTITPTETPNNINITDDALIIEQSVDSSTTSILTQDEVDDSNSNADSNDVEIISVESNDLKNKETYYIVFLVLMGLYVVTYMIKACINCILAVNKKRNNQNVDYSPIHMNDTTDDDNQV